MKKLITWLILFLLSSIVFKVLSVIGFTVNVISIMFHKNRIESLAEYFKVLAVSEDQLGGSYIYKTEDWTVSSYNYYLGVVKKKKFVLLFMKFVDYFPRLFNIQQNHCEESYFAERKQLQNQHIFDYDTKRYKRNTEHFTC